jgi:hypothetical protein
MGDDADHPVAEPNLGRESARLQRLSKRQYFGVILRLKRFSEANLSSSILNNTSGI